MRNAVSYAESSAPQVTVFQPIIIAPPIRTTQKLPPTSHELQIPSTSAPREALQEVLPKAGKGARESPKNYGFDQDDSSGVSTNSCPPNWLQPRRKRQVGNIESIQPSVVPSIIDTAAQSEPIPNPYPSSVNGIVSPTIPQIGPADHLR